MSTFYFSGIEKRATASVLGGLRASGMMSQLLYTPNLMAACDEYEINLTMDSGAFSKALEPEDIAEYAALIERLGDRCVWYANADSIGNQEQSNKNYDYLLSLLPESLHSRILWIYQYGSDLDYLLEGLKRHSRVGIGGLVPLLQSDKTLALQVIIQLARIVAQYDVEPHYFGLSIPGIIEHLHGYHESFSVDSTTWLMGGKYGLLINNQGKQRSASEGGYDFSTHSILEQNVRTMRKWVEGQDKKKSRSPYVQLSFLDRQEVA